MGARIFFLAGEDQDLFGFVFIEEGMICLDFLPGKAGVVGLSPDREHGGDHDKRPGFVWIYFRFLSIVGGWPRDLDLILG